MPRKGHTEEQILQALRQAEGGDKATEICRKLGVSPGCGCIRCCRASSGLTGDISRRG
jgi:hypothetical protein